MQAAARLARIPRLAVHRAAAVRCMATAASHVSASASPSSTPKQSVIPLGNVEAQWANLNQDDKSLVIEQLEELQKKDWKQLSIDEKKAAYYVAFGPHGPRTPIHPPGTILKIFLGTMGLVGAAGALFLALRQIAPPPPKTLTKEWEEASNERAIEQKMNPITGITSEGYSGKGFVQHK
ncbi:hypothetical protein CCMSSC00406_0005830 [Pleurotus cornucopiae]|uniref:Uncharacterized protein n=1 Tax=Pleurotus cornucopiae TaxID=5321 RepID=A0ACB7J9G1_PLECO|nr:hypothetical protein CCMSSC00406_0005830 [Pleurotus cornucopiae]